MRFTSKALIGAAAFALMSAAPATAQTAACLITKTDTNPFFVKMKEGAEAKAAELGVSLKSYAGKVDGDHESQVAAIEACIADGAKGILIAASDTKAIVDSVATARAAGLLVIALDTPLEPIDAADATFATDNFKAGLLIGQWTAAKLGADAANAKIALLDLAISQPSVDVLRDQGFLTGMGIDTADINKWGDETDPRIVGNEVTAGNEPAAAGAFEALKAAGKTALIVSVDGGCPGVADVKDGVIGATSQQYPLLMASLGIEAIAKFAADGSKPAPSDGKDFFDTGVALITDQPVEGVESIDSTKGAELCWG